MRRPGLWLMGLGLLCLAAAALLLALGCGSDKPSAPKAEFSPQPALSPQERAERQRQIWAEKERRMSRERREREAQAKQEAAQRKLDEAKRKAKAQAEAERRARRARQRARQRRLHRIGVSELERLGLYSWAYGVEIHCYPEESGCEQYQSPDGAIEEAMCAQSQGLVRQVVVLPDRSYAREDEDGDSVWTRRLRVICRPAASGYEQVAVERLRASSVKLRAALKDAR